MGQKRNITDFFKPFAHPLPQVAKRPLAECSPDDSEPPAKSRSATPRSSPRTASSSDHKLPGNTDLGQSSANASDIPTTRGSADAATQSELGQEGDRTAIAAEQLESGQEKHRAASEYAPSQSPLLASSQRVVKHGEVMIRNSDDEESESDSSLGDIDDLLNFPKKPDPVPSSPLTDLGSTPPSLPGRSSPEEIGRTRRQTRAIVRTNTTTDRYAPLPQPKYKFDLETLVQRSAKHEKSQAMMSKARDTLKSMEKRDVLDAPRSGGDSEEKREIDSGMVASALKGRGEPSEGERLMMAVQRTEALQEESSWSFFERSEEDVTYAQATFPKEKPEHCAALFKDTSTRQQAFLGGYVGDLASNGRLPDDLILWLFDAACFDSREDLRHAYRYCVKEAKMQITSLLTPARIDTLFRKIGANEAALDMKCQVMPTARIPGNAKDGSSRVRLISLLGLIHDIATNLSVKARRHAICLLCRMLVDQDITRNASVLIKLEDTLEMLFDSMPEDSAEQELQHILAALFTSMKDISLRSQLVDKLPASSPTQSLLRRRLSLAFFFNNADYLTKDANKLLNLGSVCYQLTKPDYTVNKTTNFTDLAASISILSIGVDNGDPPLAGLNSRAERAFDDAIDMLAREVRALNDRIVDTGASHMKRTQAKQVLGGFHTRLLYAVRRKPPRKINVFGDTMADPEHVARQKEYMEKHVMSTVGLRS